MNYSNILRAVACVMLGVSYSSDVLGETISIAQIVRKWEQSRIPEIQCEIHRTVALPAMSPPAFGGAPKNLPAQQKSEVLSFSFIYGLGMRMDNHTTGEKNSSDAQGGVKVRGLDGNDVQRSIIEPQGNTSIQSSSDIVPLLLWLDPMGAKLGREISQLSGGRNFELLDSNQLASKVVVINLASGGRATLAQDFDWRVVAFEQPAKGYQQEHGLQMDYSRAQENAPVRLLGWSSYGRLGSGIIKQYAEVKSWKFSVTPEDVKLSLPVSSLVIDAARPGTENSYIIRKNGQRREILEAEIAQRIPLGTLMVTEPGEALAQPTTVFTLSRVLLVLGSALIIGGIAYWLRGNLSKK